MSSVNKRLLGVKTKRRLFIDLKKQKYLHMMTIPGIIFLFIFCYWPMFGLIIAFQDYDIIKGFFDSQFVGLANFKELFSDTMFWAAFRNSIGLSLVKASMGFFSPIILAILLNEISFSRIKRAIQTMSYLPHFISWVVIAGIFSLWLDSTGMINDVLLKLNLIEKPVSHLADPGKFWLIMALIDTWKETGWWAIIYLAAIAGIPLELYEAAIVDGAGRLRRIFNITLPGMKDTIIVILILTMGSLLSGGLNGSNFNQSMLFGNVLNRDSSDIIETYSLRMGLNVGRFSFATAAGLFQSIISLTLFTITNKLSEKFGGSNIY
jgi:putative aldouronate transport system permease protein